MRNYLKAEGSTRRRQPDGRLVRSGYASFHVVHEFDTNQCQFDSWHPHLVLRPFIDASGLGTEVKKVKLYPCYDIDKWLFIYTWSLIWKRSATAAGPGGEEGLMGVDIWKGVPVKLFKVQEAPVTVYT